MRGAILAQGSEGEHSQQKLSYFRGSIQPSRLLLSTHYIHRVGIATGTGVRDP